MVAVYGIDFIILERNGIFGTNYHWIITANSLKTVNVGPLKFLFLLKYLENVLFFFFSYLVEVNQLWAMFFYFIGQHDYSWLWNFLI